MKDHNPHDPVNMIGEAYELLLEKTMHDLHVHDGTDSTKTAQSADQTDAPSNTYMRWIENKKFLLKNTTLEYLRDAGDETTVTLRRLNHPKRTLSKYKGCINKPDNILHSYRTRAANTNSYSGKKKNSFRRLQ